MLIMIKNNCLFGDVVEQNDTIVVVISQYNLVSAFDVSKVNSTVQITVSWHDSCLNSLNTHET